MHFLIVKHGALGDVVRTSYFAGALKAKHGERLRLSWITAPAAIPLLQFNPQIDDLWTSFDEARSCRFDRVWSLDDEREVLEGVAALSTARLSGAFLDSCGNATYSDDVAEWFDIGLLSRFGKAKADELKKLNVRTHGDIFSNMFGVSDVQPAFFGDERLEQWAAEWLGNRKWHIGINSFAGGRWPSKELPERELGKLIQGMLSSVGSGLPQLDIVLLGANEDRERNTNLAANFQDSRVRVVNTDDSVLRLAAVVSRLNYLISSDSLAMHLAVAQRVPFLAFFSPTSAAEIGDFGFGCKVVSSASDYCSYRKDADNTTITAERLLGLLQEHIAAL